MNLIQSDTEVNYLIKWWGTIGCLAAILGFFHFYFADSVYLRALNLDMEGIEKGVMDQRVGWIRWVWAGCEPNFQGLQLLIPFVINLNTCFKKSSVCNIILTIVSFLGIVGTFSRTSFICALCATLYMLLLTSGKVKYVVMSVIICIAFFAISSFPEYVDRISTISEDISTTEGNGRFALYGESIDNFLDSPIMGVGTGQTVLYSSTKHEAHNSFLQILGENGIVTFIIFMSIFIDFITKTYKYRKKTNLFFIAGIAVFLNMNTVTMIDLRTILSFMALFYILRYNSLHNINSLT